MNKCECGIRKFVSGKTLLLKGLFPEPLCKIPEEMVAAVCRAFVLLVFCFSVAQTSRGADGVFSKDFTAEAGGFAVVSIDARTPGYSWSMPGAAPALDVSLDGKFVSNIVLFAGEKPFAYRVLAGPVAAGGHTIEIKPNEKRKSESDYIIDGVKLDVAAEGSAEYEAYKRAPLLYGREENDVSDTPILMWVEVSKNPDGGADYMYSYIWSNEDGGTKTASLMARYGRTVDIEHAITVSVSPDGKTASELYQTLNHKIDRFRGRHIGKRAVMKVATKNNVFTDGGDSSLYFSLVPVVKEPLPDVREVLLDSNPWICRIMYEELLKEGKASAEGTGADLTKAAAPGGYVYVDLLVEPMLTPGYKLDVQVRLKGSEEWHSSVHGVAGLELDNPGWSRAGVPVGRQLAGPEEVEAVRVLLLNAAAGGRVQIKGIKRLVVLDKDYNAITKELPRAGAVMLGKEKPEIIVKIISGMPNIQ